MVGHDGKSPVPMADEVLTAEQREAYLASVRSGAGLALSAAALGDPDLTATKLRALRRRDPVFRAEVEEARAEAHEVYLDRLRATARLRATGAEVSDRMLEVELATHDPAYQHLRRNRMTVDGSVRHVIGFDPEALDRLSEEQILALREIVVAMDGDVVDAEIIEDVG